MITGRPVKYQVNLTKQELAFCKNITGSTLCETVKKRGMVLAGLNNYSPGELSYKQIATSHNVSADYATNVAKIYNIGGMDAITTITRNPSSDLANLKLDLRAEAHLLSMACTPPPEPNVRWSVSLCHKELVKAMEERGLQSDFSRTSVWRALDRNELKPHRSEYWCIPELTPLYIQRMEKILHLYSLEYNQNYPIVCMDECALMILSDIIPRLMMKAGDTEKIDYEYGRLGTKNLFVLLEPKTGKYFIRLTDSRTAIDWAYEIKNLAEKLYPDAKKIIIIADNLNTHTIESLYKAFPAEVARSLVERIEIYYTPFHGSWLNTAEIGINVVKRGCIPSRFKTESEAAELPEKIQKWTDEKNSNPIPINWKFTSKDAHTHPHLTNLPEVKTSSFQKYILFNDCDTSNTTTVVQNSIYIPNYNEEKESENIIDLCRSIDKNGNEHWAISFTENRIALSEPTGKKAISSIVNKRSTNDGWLIPYPSNPRPPKKEGKKPREIKYDYNFMAFGEDIIEVYNREYNEKYPVICIRKRAYDEQDLSKNTWAHTLKAEPKPKKEKKKENTQNKVSNTEVTGEESESQNSTSQNADTADSVEKAEEKEDTRLGITFMYEPHTGQKYFRISDYADDLSWAESLQDLVDNKYPEAEKITLIMCDDDQFKVASLLEKYSADEALRIDLKLDVHVTPKDALWLNFSEIEAIVECRKCLNDGVSSVEDLYKHLKAWTQIETKIGLHLNLKSFRDRFSKVYKPMGSASSSP